MEADERVECYSASPTSDNSRSRTQISGARSSGQGDVLTDGCMDHRSMPLVRILDPFDHRQCDNQRGSVQAQTVYAISSASSCFGLPEIPYAMFV
jgi:hypothetical protein